jgi:hypothetical protein
LFGEACALISPADRLGTWRVDAAAHHRYRIGGQRKNNPINTR